ncbi:dual specificity protein kinase shkC-like isoform X2 [Schistocerca gregaria]|uniref:dual specificity protein kinase shkC-like isoform X2 n=1 Tax=Schistocerca gregaria TaxID=7010 RepID=UPI00211EAFF2|nr:dual specificity protein kinase shkC-like isoform X2 [Schistocerca gregaria]
MSWKGRRHQGPAQTNQRQKNTHRIQARSGNHEPGNFFIVSEFLTGGNVEKLLHDPTVKLSLYRRMCMAKDAALGMNWLHCSKPSVIHRDLKTSNLLIDENGRVKLCDFGLSQLMNPGQHLKDSESVKGTPLWMAPEVMQFRAFNEKSDIYSFGIVLWELLTRRQPFVHHSDYKTFRFAVCKRDERPLISPSVEPRLKSLIERCWDPNPEKRPSTVEILKELDIILINVAIKDSYGRIFWTQNFRNSEQFSDAPWNIFALELLRFLTLPIPDPSDHENQTVLNLKCLKALLLKKNRSSDCVNIQDFGRILSLFGPIACPDENNRTFLDRIYHTLRNEWFHGDIDKDSAEALLSGKLPETFLVRFSSVEGFFTISYITTDNIIKHQRVCRKSPTQYVIGNREYESLSALVHGEGLRYPCPGNVYQRIFKEKPQFGYVELTK